FDRDAARLFVSDLGTDEVVAYAWDGIAGKLERRNDLCYKARPGSGPRILAFHPRESFAYTVNELDSTVSVLSRDSESAPFREIQAIGTLPSSFAGRNTCADLHLSPSGDFLYASNRGHDSIAAFKVAPRTGILERAGCFSSEGKTPRSFAIDPSGSFLLAANQDTDNVVVFEVDRATGALRATGQDIVVPTPVCVRVYDAMRELS
ncbi:MAG: beta-propeller fold lactonase family protein, partial [Spirochaetaceae bacterium]|nr:beta-propeller fold lactonase family protein [Spirochaetaceae bacterium]